MLNHELLENILQLNWERPLAYVTTVIVATMPSGLELYSRSISQWLESIHLGFLHHNIIMSCVSLYRHGYEAQCYEAEAKPKLWSNHEAETKAETLIFFNYEAEAEAEALAQSSFVSMSVSLVDYTTQP